MAKLFGTDGIRGIANQGLDAQLAFRVGLAAALVLAEEDKTERPVFTIGKDTRISSDMLECAIIAGLCSAGADVLRLGVIPTPAVAWITAQRRADAGIVISASHNPFEHNGIKLFNAKGNKLSDELECKIEELILSEQPLPVKTHGELGRVIDAGPAELEHYVDYLAATITEPLAGLSILVDCANGAASATAPKLFARFPKLRVDFVHAQPNGWNINNGCGSTHIEQLSERVREGGYDLCLAFDGDADRCLAMDETGQTIDGDQIMAVCALAMQQEGALAGSAIVGTVMSNLGLHLFAREHGLTLICTDVGDRHVLQRMQDDGLALGGEQSGHIIFARHATTGDGQLTGVQLLQILCQSGKKASQLAGVCKKYPQTLLNVPVSSREAKEKVMSSPALRAAIAQEEAGLGEGRILVRPSGTEALIRVMVEAAGTRQAQDCARRLADFIANLAQTSEQ